MNCQAFEEPIGRYVGGDLTSAEVQSLVRHLRTCENCANLAYDLEEDRSWLSSRPLEASDIDFAAMRREIRQVISQRRRRRRWLPALTAAAAILLVVGVSTIRRRPALQPLTPLAAVPAPPSSVARPPVRQQARGKSAIRGSRAEGGVRPTQAASELTLEAAIRMFQELDREPPPPPTGSDSPVEMRIATNDPNITIILLQESKGDSR